MERNRIALSMRSAPGGRKKAEAAGRPGPGKAQKPLRKKPGGKPGLKKDHRKRNEPFNNPFADLLKKRS
jgi:hypothetical protein